MHKIPKVFVICIPKIIIPTSKTGADPEGAQMIQTPPTPTPNTHTHTTPPLKSKIHFHKERTWRSGVRSAMCAASQLSGRGPTNVDVAPVPAR